MKQRRDINGSTRKMPSRLPTGNRNTDGLSRQAWKESSLEDVDTEAQALKRGKVEGRWRGGGGEVEGRCLDPDLTGSCS